MQATAGQRLHLRLFLEGIEVPVIAAQVQISINAPATASIQIVPSDGALNLKARTMVHLFFWDIERGPSDPATLNTSTSSAKGATISSDSELKGYKLMFCGELIGISMAKNAMGRQMTLQCSDFSTYWDTTYQMMISYSPNGNFLWEQSSIWAGGSNLFDNIMSGHGMVLAQYLNSSPKTKGLEKIQGLMGGIVSLLEAMGGVPDHSHGVNDFFTIGEIKNHILQQIVCEQNDDTAKRLFSSQQFWQWLMGGASSLGELCTFRDMLMLLFKYIFYELVPNPCAMYIPMKQAVTKQKVVTTGGGTVFVPSDVAARIRTMMKEANTISGMSVAQLELNKDNNIKTLHAHVDSYASFGINPDIPGVVKTILSRAEAVSSSIAKNIEFDRASWALEAKLLAKALNITVPVGKKTVSSSVGAELDRLQTHIFRPDCFFAAPPRCNVLFPDQYMQLSYNRAFLQEITRLRLSIGWFLNPGGEGILGQTCFAPAMEDIRRNAKKQGLSGLRALLPWEIYTGILPKFEHTNELLFVSNARDQKLTKGYKGTAVDYAQRVANFNYMKYRFAARSCEVQAKFSPRMVCGFPTLIIDRPFILDPVAVTKAYESTQVQANLSKTNTSDFLSRFKIIMNKLTETYYNPPTQYLGQVASLAHSVDQKGGFTSVSVTHGHTHRLTDDDFLSLWAQQKSKGSKMVYTPLAAFEIIEKGDFTKFKFLVDATPQVEPQTTTPGATRNPYATPSTTRPTGAPSMSNVPSDSYDSAFLLLDLAGQVTAPPLPTPTSSGGTSFGEAPLIGAVTKGVLPNTTQPITVPADPVPLLGKRGPRKGTVAAVQLNSDALWKFEADNPDMSKFSKSARSKIKKLFKKNKVLYLWVNCVVWEQQSSKDPLLRDIPVEESLRPPWFSPLYSSLFIGDQIYTPFFGCGSIVDEAVFAGAGTVGIFGANTAFRNQIMAEFAAADGDLMKIRETLSQAQQNNIADIPSVEQAVDALAYVYGEVIRLNQDVQRFIADYTYRPIASMYDIFGSQDLQYDLVPGAKVDTLKLTQGTPGFHSTAVAPFSNLAGLLDNPDLEIPRLYRSSGKTAPVDPSLDPRPGRREMADNYAAELEEGHGVIGSALRG